MKVSEPTRTKRKKEYCCGQHTLHYTIPQKSWDTSFSVHFSLRGFSPRSSFSAGSGQSRFTGVPFGSWRSDGTGWSCGSSVGLTRQPGHPGGSPRPGGSWRTPGPPGTRGTAAGVHVERGYVPEVGVVVLELTATWCSGYLKEDSSVPLLGNSHCHNGT